MSNMRRPVASVETRSLRDLPDDGLATPGTSASRLALVETLTMEAWALAGRSVPVYARAEMPVSVRPLQAAAAHGRRAGAPGG